MEGINLLKRYSAHILMRSNGHSIVRIYFHRLERTK